LTEEVLRSSLELHKNLGRGVCNALARPDHERRDTPTPGIDLDTVADIDFNPGIAGESLSHSIAFARASYHVLRLQGPGRPQDLDLLIAQAVGGPTAWSVHRQHGEDLEQVVLQDVSNRAGFFVEGPSPLDAEAFGHRDLNALDVIAVPD